jgi:hypothetical protein
MNRLTGTCFFLCFHVALCIPNHAGIAKAQTSGVSERARPSIAEWVSPKVEHAYGLPETKAPQKGSLTINSGGLTFTGKSGSYNVPRAALLALRTGNERVELWGMKGRLLRMAIPDGGGIAAAGVMHHKVNMLSVEFKDVRDGYHAAVFYVPAGEAEHVIASFADLLQTQYGNSTSTSASKLETSVSTCQDGSINPRSVLITMPAWNQTEVPAAYRAFLYEHTVDRLQRLEGIGHVYREGETEGQKGCPEYTIRVSVSAFKQGSQVKRAVMGPVGMFIGTTQMSFNINITDTTGRLNVTEQLKATVRGESESKNVADSVAKTIDKRYASETKKFEKTRMTSAGKSTRL